MRGSATLELFSMLSDRLSMVVPFDGVAEFRMDRRRSCRRAPGRIENIEPGHCESYWEREATVEVTLLFRDLARAASPSGLALPGHGPAPRARYRQVLASQNYGDEARGVF